MALTDANGNSDVQYSYGPYGTLSITGTTTNSYDYTGRESDGLGIYYYRARYYNPATGRFISEDPTGFSGGINEYAYAGDSPSNFIDPSGNDKKQFCYGSFGFGGLEVDGGEGGGFQGGIVESNSVSGYSGGSLVEGWIGGRGRRLELAR